MMSDHVVSAESPTQPPVRVLLVDDDGLVRRTITTMLESCDYRVLALANGDEALDQLEQLTFDLAILDVMMPGLSGLEVCRRIKGSQRGRALPVVLLTALGEPEDVIAGLEAGADEFLTKPIHLPVLQARLRALLRFQAVQRDSGVMPTLPELVAARVSELAARGALSPRERQVLDLLLLGRTMEEIGLVLEISARTVKFHQANVLDKLGAESRLDLLRLIL